MTAGAEGDAGIGFFGGGDADPDEDDEEYEDDLSDSFFFFCWRTFSVKRTDGFCCFFGLSGEDSTDSESEDDEVASSGGDTEGGLRGLIGEAELESRRARSTGEDPLRRGGGEGLR